MVRKYTVLVSIFSMRTSPGNNRSITLRTVSKSRLALFFLGVARIDRPAIELREPILAHGQRGGFAEEGRKTRLGSLRINEFRFGRVATRETTERPVSTTEPPRSFRRIGPAGQGLSFGGIGQMHKLGLVIGLPVQFYRLVAGDHEDHVVRLLARLADLRILFPLDDLGSEGPIFVRHSRRHPAQGLQQALTGEGTDQRKRHGLQQRTLARAVATQQHDPAAEIVPVMGKVQFDGLEALDPLDLEPLEVHGLLFWERVQGMVSEGESGKHLC